MCLLGEKYIHNACAVYLIQLSFELTVVAINLIKIDNKKLPLKILYGNQMHELK